MKKRITAMILVLLFAVLMFSAATVFCEEGAEVEDIPQLTMKLNPEGTSSMSMVIQMEQEDIDSYIDYYKDALTPEGYEVSKSEDSLAMIISKSFEPEDGYLVDFSMFGMGTVKFVEFNDVFCNRYGIKSEAFNAEKDQTGRDYFTLTIETPVKASYSNAAIQEGSGKINTWKISSGSKNEINLTFKKYNTVAIVVTIAVIILFLLLLFAVVRNNKKKKEGALEVSDVLTASEDTLYIEGEQEGLEDSNEQ